MRSTYKTAFSLAFWWLYGLPVASLAKSHQDPASVAEQNRNAALLAEETAGRRSCGDQLCFWQQARLLKVEVKPKANVWWISNPRSGTIEARKSSVVVEYRRGHVVQNIR